MADRRVFNLSGMVSLPAVLRYTSLFTLAAGTFLWLGTDFRGLYLAGFSALLHLLFMLMQKGKKDTAALIRSLLRGAAVPASGIILAVLSGALIMLLTGYDPVKSYSALFYGGFVKNWHVSVLNATPLVFTGLSIAVAFRAGLFNIGAEGQYYIGAMAGAWLGLTLDLPPILTVIAIYVAASLLAALWNLVPAVLKIRTGAHEVITTMMFAHIARYFSPVFIRAFGGDPATSRHPYVTYELGEAAWLPLFRDFIPSANYRLHTGILIAVIAAIAVRFFLVNTKTGFEIRSVGSNREASAAQGISAGKNILIAMLMAGSLAGMAGITQVLGLDHKLFENLQAGYGWNGISVALLASNNPVGIIFTSLLWGALDAGGQYMSRTTQTPGSIVEIVKGIMLFLIVARYIYIYAGKRFRRKREAGNG